MAKINFNGVVREMTEEEISARKEAMTQYVLFEKRRALRMDEVTAMLVAAQINTLAVDDNTALRMKAFYPLWAAGTSYSPVGCKVRHDGRLWKLRTEHTSQAGWEPGTIGTESLWEQVHETHSGTIDDPIAYNGNMALVSGLYYHQNGVIYLCSRDTENAVYNALADLVGLYVVKV